MFILVHTYFLKENALDLAYENVDWSNSSRTILDFRGVSLNSQTRILKKLKNNFNVSYQELSPELLIEVKQFLIHFSGLNQPQPPKI